MAKKNDKTHLGLYVLSAVVLVFLFFQFGMTGEVTINLTPSINSGEVLLVEINTEGTAVKQEYDIYRHNELGTARRYIQNYGNVCQSSKCNGEFVINVKTSDNWETGKYSVRIENWKGNGYTESFFRVNSIYPPKGVQVHR